MPVYRKKGSPYWYVRIGRGYDKSSGTADRAEALALEGRIRHELFHEKPRKGYTFGEAAARWAEDVGSKRKGWGRDWYRVKRLVENLGSVRVEEVDQSATVAAIPDKAKASASRAHYLSLVRSILRHAHSAGVISSVPAFRIPAPKNARLRYLTGWPEANRLIDAMPEHWRDPARFTLYTGVRLGTLRALRREWLSGDLLVIPGAHTKSGRMLPLPLAPEALRIAHRQPQRPHLFTRPNGQGLPKMHWKTWQRVRALSGIEDFRWHDLRHTWASWAVMNGVTLYELQQLGDWSTPAMVQRYAHLSPEYLRGAASKLGVPHISAPVPHHDKPSSDPCGLQRQTTDGAEEST